jgi:hypothetical protein
VITFEIQFIKREKGFVNIKGKELTFHSFVPLETENMKIKRNMYDLYAFFLPI